MSADFWASYLSGASSIVVGNPLDIIKVRVQAGQNQTLRAHSTPSALWLRGSAAPILGYGALNSLLFVTYNQSLRFLDSSVTDSTNLASVKLADIWIAGGIGGLASWVVSAPSELVKCRAQLSPASESSSLTVLKDAWRREGLTGLYLGGSVTGLRDSVGYGFYFWSYELSKRLLAASNQSQDEEATTTNVLVSGGIAGVVTWASIYPLDVIKTKVQTQDIRIEKQNVSRELSPGNRKKIGAMQITREIYRSKGLQGFYRGLGICSIRAFIVNAVQWYTYEKAILFISSF